MANPKITNPALVTRNEQFLAATHVTIDGSAFQADTVLPRGTILVRSAVGGKFHPAVHGTDTLAPNMVRVLADERKVTAGLYTFASAYMSGFFSSAWLKQVNASYTDSELATAGFQPVETDEVWMK